MTIKHACKALPLGTNSLVQEATDQWANKHREGGLYDGAGGLMQHMSASADPIKLAASIAWFLSTVKDKQPQGKQEVQCCPRVSVTQLGTSRPMSITNQTFKCHYANTSCSNKQNNICCA